MDVYNGVFPIGRRLIKPYFIEVKHRAFRFAVGAGVFNTLITIRNKIASIPVHHIAVVIVKDFIVFIIGLNGGSGTAFNYLASSIYFRNDFTLVAVS